MISCQVCLHVPVLHMTDPPPGPLNKWYSPQWQPYPQDIRHFGGRRHYRDTILAKFEFPLLPLSSVFMSSVEFHCVFSFETPREKTHIFEPTPPIEIAQKVSVMESIDECPSNYGG